jgi:hypothetical protein
MVEKLIEELSKYIKSIEIDGNTIINNGKNIKIVEVMSKYSSVKKPTIKIKVGDKLCKRHDRLTYDCPMCNSSSNILVGRFLSKKSKYCYRCKENNEEKRKKQSEFIVKSYADFNKVTPKNRKEEKNDIVDISNNLFKNESDDFKKEYFKRNLTSLEFDKIKGNIKSINGVNILNKHFIYYTHLKVNNQIKYSSKVFVDGKFILLTNCEFCCEVCDDEFKSRNLKSKLNNNIICPSCNLSNKVFKFKSILNINGDKVVYQSKPEFSLINFLNDNNILVKNGPRIIYDFRGDSKVYKVDFEIPKFKHLVEVKGDHIWHRDQIESGKWEAKESSANMWCKRNKYTYKLIFDIKEYINSISLLLNENWNPKVNREVKEFVEYHKYNLSQLWDDNLSEDENVDKMIKYFTKYPDEMKSIINGDKLTLPMNKSTNIKNVAPILQNIGGVHDFKSTIS